MNPISLYVHIPFCRQKCDYCDFFSVPSKDGISDSYIDSLLREAEFYFNSFQIQTLKTIYVGGGTPSLLKPSQIEKFFSGIRNLVHISEDAEITVEMNPESVTEDFVSACEKSGVNRISLGIQALDEKALFSVHRICSPETALNCLSFLEKNWNHRLSVDFIAGLPKQTYKSFENQFETIFKFKKIDHISLYTLTIEEKTPLGKRFSDGKLNFSFDKADRMWIRGRNILEKNGFLQYEVSNFSRPGFESRHNSTYWKLESYIGIGAGASGSVYEKNLRWNNLNGIKNYLDFWKNPYAEKISSIRETEIIDAEIQQFEYLMMGFRLLKGISEKDFYLRFGKNLFECKNSEDEEFSEIFERWKKLGFLKISGKSPERKLALNRRGILLLNRFLQEIM